MTDRYGPPAELPEARVRTVAEALYSLLPAHIRLRDAEAGRDALRALFGVLARSSAEIDAEIDRYYDALFVETAPEDALAAIAALVAGPVLQPMPEGSGCSRRALIANTIRYRRGKGTARVVEGMAADVGGLAAVAVEYFQRIARLAHLIDPRPDRPATAALRDGQTAARAGRAFDYAARLTDLRPLASARRGGPAGRHGVTALGVHVLRVLAPAYAAPEGDDVSPERLAGVPPMQPWPISGTVHPGYFQLSAQPGHVVRLFNPRRLAAAAGVRPSRTDLPDRLIRLPLDRETTERRRAALEARKPQLEPRPWFDDLGNPFAVFIRRDGDTKFARIPPERIRIANLETEPSPAGPRPPASLGYEWWTPGGTVAVPHQAAHPIDCAFDPVTARAVFAAPVAPAGEVVEVRLAHAVGIGRLIGAGPQDRNTAETLFEVRDSGGLSHVVRWVDPVAPVTGSPGDARRSVADLATALAEVGQLGGGRRSLVICTRCDVASPTLPATDFELTVPPESEVHLVAAAWRSPATGPDAPPDPPLGYIIRRDRRLTVAAPMKILRAPGSTDARAGRVVIDGLEFTDGLEIGDSALSELTLRHVTLRHPGHAALTAAGKLAAARIECESSILGPVRLTGGPGGVSGDLAARECLFAADGAAGDVLELAGLDTRLRDATVLGTSTMRSLEATNVLFAQAVRVTRRQTGCIRYSFAPATQSALPRSYRCQPGLALAAARAAKDTPLTEAEEDATRMAVEPVLMDTDLDEPTVAMLHPLCPAAIREGGEDGAEIGVFARAACGTAEANITALFAEILPLALEGAVIDDSQSGAVALRRNRP